MAKKTEEKLNYAQEQRRLKENGPEKLYFLWGPEDYLREHYLEQLKKLCLPEGEDSFSFKRLNGPELDPLELANAIDAVPFLSERSFVELRGIDVNRQKDGDRLVKILSDIPDYCTVVFVQGAEYEPDGRIKLVKSLRSMSREIRFTQQNQGDLVRWVAKRFAALGKGIELEAAQRLLFISGDLMNRLIPEIEKIAAFAKGDKVTVADVETVAIHIPEAVIFEMTELISQRKINNALATLAELLMDKDNEPIAMLAILGTQMRRLYGAKLAQERKLGSQYLMKTCGCKTDYHVSKMMQAARGYTLDQLKQAVKLCAEGDVRMKSSAGDEREILKEIVFRIAAGESHGQG